MHPAQDVSSLSLNHDLFILSCKCCKARGMEGGRISPLETNGAQSCKEEEMGSFRSTIRFAKRTWRNGRYICQRSLWTKAPAGAAEVLLARLSLINISPLQAIPLPLAVRPVAGPCPWLDRGFRNRISPIRDNCNFTFANSAAKRACSWGRQQRFVLGGGGGGKKEGGGLGTGANVRTIHNTHTHTHTQFWEFFPH